MPGRQAPVQLDQWSLSSSPPPPPPPTPPEEGGLAVRGGQEAGVPSDPWTGRGARCPRGREVKGEEERRCAHALYFGWVEERGGEGGRLGESSAESRERARGLPPCTCCAPRTEAAKWDGEHTVPRRRLRATLGVLRGLPSLPAAEISAEINLNHRKHREPLLPSEKGVTQTRPSR